MIYYAPMGNNPSSAIRPRILVTGAAGLIGTSFRSEYREKYSDHYDLRLGVHDQLDDKRFDDIVQLEILDKDSLRRAMEGVDQVLHLAAIADPRSSFEERMEDPNVHGTYNVFQVAHEQGLQRVIFASSIHAVKAHETQPIPSGTCPKPDCLYGATKAWGEALCGVYSSAEGSPRSCFAVRIGAFRNEAMLQDMSQEHAPRMVSYRDLCHLFDRCIMAPYEVSYGIFHGLSDNREKVMAIDHARELVGYDPQDDGFDYIEQ